MWEADEFEKELDELNGLLRDTDVSVVRNIKLLVKDYIENEERAISN